MPHVHNYPVNFQLGSRTKGAKDSDVTEHGFGSSRKIQHQKVHYTLFDIDEYNFTCMQRLLLQTRVISVSLTKGREVHHESIARDFGCKVKWDTALDKF